MPELPGMITKMPRIGSKGGVFSDYDQSLLLARTGQLLLHSA